VTQQTQLSKVHSEFHYETDQRILSGISNDSLLVCDEQLANGLDKISQAVGKALQGTRCADAIKVQRMGVDGAPQLHHVLQRWDQIMLQETLKRALEILDYYSHNHHNTVSHSYRCHSANTDITADIDAPRLLIELEEATAGWTHKHEQDLPHQAGLGGGFGQWQLQQTTGIAIQELHVADGKVGHWIRIRGQGKNLNVLVPPVGVDCPRQHVRISITYTVLGGYARRFEWRQLNHSTHSQMTALIIEEAQWQRLGDAEVVAPDATLVEARRQVAGVSTSIRNGHLHGLIIDIGHVQQAARGAHILSGQQSARRVGIRLIRPVLWEEERLVSFLKVTW